MNFYKELFNDKPVRALIWIGVAEAVREVSKDDA